MDQVTHRADAPVPVRDWYKPFLATLSVSANVKDSAAAAQISRKTAYEARKADPAFAQAWDEALADAVDDLEKVAWERARNQSDDILKFVLRAHHPKYREASRIELTGAEGGPIQQEVTVTHERITRIVEIVKELGIEPPR